VCTTLAALALLQAQAQAALVDDGKLSISGFGTLGVAKSDTDVAKFARYNQATGVGDSWRLGLDTNLGLQASYKVSEQLSGTVQVLTRKNTSTSFTTDLTWAFLKYKASDELSVRAGRVQMPTFLISDYQNVGYANTMMRPPIELYGQVPIENLDGVDVNYQHAFGDTNFTAQAAVGSARGKLFVAAAATVAHYRAPSHGISLSLEHGPLMLRYAHLQAKMNSDDVTPVNTLANTLAAVGFAQLGRDIGFIGGKKIKFDALGATLDWNNLLLQAEFGKRRSVDPIYVAQTDAWYVLAGYRIGAFLPYYAHASYKGKGTSVTLPANFPASGALSTAVRGLLTPAEQDSNLVGLRWNFASAAALKLQVDQVKPKARTGSLIFGPAAGMKDKVTVFGATLDYVF
jgi:hypothetical protein